MLDPDSVEAMRIGMMDEPRICISTKFLQVMSTYLRPILSAAAAQLELAHPRGEPHAWSWHSSTINEGMPGYRPTAQFYVTMMQCPDIQGDT